MKNCLIPSILNSSVFSRISFAAGANFAANAPTGPAKVAEKRMTCGCFENFVTRLQEMSARIENLGEEISLLDLDTLISHRSLLQHVIRFVQYKHDDVREIQNSMPRYHLRN